MHVDGASSGSGRRGIIEGSARILGELIRTPRVVKSVRIVLDNLDAPAAPELVRTILYADSSLLFDAVASSPALANAAVLGVRELFTQVLALPEALLRRMLPRLLSEVQGEALGEAAGLALRALGRAVQSDGGPLDAAARDFEQDFKQGLRSGLGADADVVDRQVAQLAGTIRRLAKENPALMSRVVRPLVQACRDALEEGSDA